MKGNDKVPDNLINMDNLNAATEKAFSLVVIPYSLKMSQHIENGQGKAKFGKDSLWAFPLWSAAV